jgi:hypothetical protein
MFAGHRLQPLAQEVNPFILTALLLKRPTWDYMLCKITQITCMDHNGQEAQVIMEGNAPSNMLVAMHDNQGQAHISLLSCCLPNLPVNTATPTSKKPRDRKHNAASMKMTDHAPTKMSGTSVTTHKWANASSCNDICRPAS